MRQIKIILISLYVIILGFIVFGNTSVYADETTISQTSQYVVSSGVDDYFKNVQDYFDQITTTYNYLNGFQQFNNLARSELRYNLNYYVELKNSSVWEERGFTIYFYSLGDIDNTLQQSSAFYMADLENYFNNRPVDTDRSLTFNGKVQIYKYKVTITNGSNTFTRINSGGTFVCPLGVVDYPHNFFFDYFSSTNGANQIASAIQQQTNTLANETQKQTNAITTATKEQTNSLLDTNDTGNDTMSVNDTTTDTSADLGGLFNQISSSFTDTTSETQKGFDLTLPNGDTYTFTLKSNVLTSFLDANPVLKAFYQAFFYVVFGGYVIFDFKKIINKLKEGNIDNVVGSSSPVDSVVNMSLK